MTAKQAAVYRLYNKALREGRLIRPDVCSMCGERRYVIGHHIDYNNPLEVTWVCRVCHTLLHRPNSVPRFYDTSYKKSPKIGDKRVAPEPREVFRRNPGESRVSLCRRMLEVVIRLNAGSRLSMAAINDCLCGGLFPPSIRRRVVNELASEGKLQLLPYPKRGICLSV